MSLHFVQEQVKDFFYFKEKIEHKIGGEKKEENGILNRGIRICRSSDLILLSDQIGASTNNNNLLLYPIVIEALFHCY